MALEHYEKAISELETMARAGTGTIDPALAATMQKNLSAIDQAIAQSRTALVEQPSSEPARTSLFEALRRKISVLQTTVALMNQMRLGDADGAARLAAGAGKKS
jgi:CHASE3 domain sensor protein